MPAPSTQSAPAAAAVVSDLKSSPIILVLQPAPINDLGIILTNPSVAALLATDNDCLSDPLAALQDDVPEGMEDDVNMDMFLNLQNLKDVDMSTDSTKRKRCEDGEEVTSQN